MKVKREVWTVLIVLISLISVFYVFAQNSAQEAAQAAASELNAPASSLPSPSTQQPTTQVGTQILYKYVGTSIPNLASLNPASQYQGTSSGIEKQLFTGYWPTANDIGKDDKHIPSVFTRLENGDSMYLTAGQKTVLDSYLKENKINYESVKVKREYDPNEPIVGSNVISPNQQTSLSKTTNAYILDENGKWIQSPTDTEDLNKITPSSDYTKQFYPNAPMIGPLSYVNPSSAGQNQNQGFIPTGCG